MGSLFFFSSRRRHTRFDCDWSSDVCSSDLRQAGRVPVKRRGVWIARVSAGEAKIDETRRQFDRYQRVDEGIEMQRLASEGEISPRRDYDCGCRQFDIFVAQPQHGSENQ